MRREDLTRASGAVVLVSCCTQRGWDRYDYRIDDSGAAEVEGREYPTAAKALAAAACACEGPYLFVELLWTSGPRAGEVWTVGTEPRLPGRDPVCSPTRHALAFAGNGQRLRDATSAEVEAARRGEPVRATHLPAGTRGRGALCLVEGPGSDAWAKLELAGKVEIR